MRKLTTINSPDNLWSVTVQPKLAPAISAEQRVSWVRGLQNTYERSGSSTARRNRGFHAVCALLLVVENNVLECGKCKQNF